MQTAQQQADHAATIRRGNRLALGFVALLTVTLVIVLPNAPIAAPTQLRLASAYVVPLPLVGFLVLAILFFRATSGSVGGLACAAGCFLIVGGIAFDIIATLIHSPDLAREANPIARILLDTGHPLALVLVYGAFAQSTVAVVLCVFWGALLRHRGCFLESAWALAGHSFGGFVKAVMGSGRLTWWEFFFSVRATIRVSPYYPFCFVLVFLIVFSILHRWYLGLRWFRVAPSAGRQVDIVLMAVFACLGYALWVYWQYRRLRRETKNAQRDSLDEPPDGPQDLGQSGSSDVIT